MTDQGISYFQPANEPVSAHSQVSSILEIMDFGNIMERGDINMIQVFFERIAQEIYNARKKNYSWGFRVIEPEFLQFSERMVLVSRLYKEENLADLNSVIFKLFIEFNNIILSTALNMHLPIRGIINIGEVYRGTLKSRKPALMSGKDPLILADLLKVFSIGDIFPEGFSEGLIPAVDMPYHFGRKLSAADVELSNIDTFGIFLPEEYGRDKITDVTILSNMITQVELRGRKWFACNWKQWMSEHENCSTENIIAFAEEEVRSGKTGAGRWQSLIDYSSRL
jgi:hypothetical protein